MDSLTLSIKDQFGLQSLEQASRVASFFTLKEYAKGEYVLQAGKCADTLVFIVSGYLRIFIDTADREVTQWISSPGYFTTDLSGFIFGSKSRWNIQALEASQCWIINKVKYDELVGQIPNWHQCERHFIVHCFTTMENRILSHLSMSSSERYQFFLEHNRELFQRVPLQYIASLLGMTPETFSRIRKKELLG